MRYYTTAIFLLFGFVLISLTTNEVQAQFCQKYYPYITQAELQICLGKPTEALIHYQKAFENTKKGHCKDYFNASLCAFENRDTTLGFRYLTLSVESGLGEKILYNNPAIALLMGSKPWKEFDKAVPNMLKKCEAQIQKKYQKMLNVYVQTYAYPNKIYSEEARSIYDELRRGLKKYGFPSVRDVGEKVHFWFVKYLVAHIHLDDTFMSNAQFKAMQKGELSPYIYARHQEAINNYVNNQDSKAREKYGNNLFYILRAYSDVYYYPIRSQEDEQRINENRAALGIGSLEEARFFVHSLRQKGDKFDNLEGYLLGAYWYEVHTTLL
ncbi:MAG: hypothetical protein EAZ55_14870, partial [Cytophagales bacterium]